MPDDAFERGLRRRRAILGDDHVDRARQNTTAFDAPFQDYVTRAVWGDVWQREGLDDRSRHLLVLALLAGLGREEEFVLHVRATARTGVSPRELAEALQLVAVYAGVPAANAALRRAKETLREMGADLGDTAGEGEERP